MAQAIDPDRCPHNGFESLVRVHRLTDNDHPTIVTGFVAEVHIRCQMCHHPFVFIGVPGGSSPAQPMVSALENELRAPIRPATADVAAVLRSIEQERGSTDGRTSRS